MRCQSGTMRMTGGTCVLALAYEGARMTQSNQTAAMLFSHFVRAVNSSLQQSLGSALLPKTGVFTSVTVGLGGERRHVFSTAAGPLNRGNETSGTINTSWVDGAGTPQERSGGRAAAAFARVACKEMGYDRAPVVTNCRGLAQLLAALPPEQDTNTTELLLTLCPDIAQSDNGCSNWFEVRDPPINDPENTQLDWVRVHAHKKGHAVVYRDEHSAELPIWQHLQRFNKVGPVPESPSCDGSERSVVRCFQHQMMISSQMRQSWTRSCGQRMLIACSGPKSGVAHLPTKQLISHTWVIGDSTDNAASALRHPKVFAAVNGPLKCSTGQLATTEEIENDVASLCWGTVLDGI
jgi:hypothetical protein